MTWNKLIMLVLFAAIGGVGLVALTAAREANEKTPEQPPPRQPSTSKRLVCLGTIDTEGPIVRIFPDNFPIPSKVTAVKVNEGDTVKAGQPLIELDTELLKLKLTEAENAIAEAKAAKGKAVAMVDGYPSMVESADKKLLARREELKAAENLLLELERAVMFKQKSQAELDEGKAKVAAAKLNIESAQADLDGLKKVGAPTYLVDQADRTIDRLETMKRQAQHAIDQFTCKAPADGRILRSFVSEGLTFGPHSKDPAFWFIKKGPLVVRAEVAQEFARRVTLGAVAKIEDEADPTQSWKGKVTKVGDQFLPKRNIGATVDLLTQSDERVLECLLAVEVPPGVAAPKYGQKVRVSLGE